MIVHFILGVWVIVFTREPPPKIDVWIFQQQAAEALFRGENPYEIQDYPDIYRSGTIDPATGEPRQHVYGPGLSDGETLNFGFPYMPLTLYLAALGQGGGGGRAVRAPDGHGHRRRPPPRRSAQRRRRGAGGGPVAVYAAGVLRADQRVDRAVQRRAAGGDALLRHAPAEDAAGHAGTADRGEAVHAAGPAPDDPARAARGRDAPGIPVSSMGGVAAPPAARVPRRTGRHAAAGAVELRSVPVLGVRGAGQGAVPLGRAELPRPPRLGPGHADAHGDGRLPGGGGGGGDDPLPVARPRTPAGFAGSVGLVHLALFAFSKQAFANYYYFVIGAFCCAAALAAPPRRVRAVGTDEIETDDPFEVPEGYAAE